MSSPSSRPLPTLLCQQCLRALQAGAQCCIIAVRTMCTKVSAVLSLVEAIMAFACNGACVSAHSSIRKRSSSSCASVQEVLCSMLGAIHICTQPLSRLIRGLSSCKACAIGTLSNCQLADAGYFPRGIQETDSLGGQVGLARLATCMVLCETQAFLACLTLKA